MSLTSNAPTTALCAPSPWRPAPPSPPPTHPSPPQTHNTPQRYWCSGQRKSPSQPWFGPVQTCHLGTLRTLAVQVSETRGAKPQGEDETHQEEDGCCMKVTWTFLTGLMAQPPSKGAEAGDLRGPLGHSPTPTPPCRVCDRGPPLCAPTLCEALWRSLPIKAAPAEQLERLQGLPSSH